MAWQPVLHTAMRLYQPVCSVCMYVLQGTPSQLGCQGVLPLSVIQLEVAYGRHPWCCR
jgi:hypothetical protein